MTLSPSSMFPSAEPPRAPNAAAQGPRPSLVSVVVPAYNESGNIEALAASIAEVFGSSSAVQPFELILVDDGSRDDTFQKIEGLCRRDPRVCGVRFVRNFGQQSALLAGLLYARGDAVVCMDADLQHPAALIPRMIDAWRRGARLVHTRRIDRDDLPAHRRWASRLYYRIFSYLSGVPIGPGMADFRLLDRCVIDEIARTRDRKLFLRGLIHWLGHRAEVIEFTPNARRSGQTKYTWRKMLRLAADGILSFSTMPLRLGLIVGAAMSAFAFLELIFVVAAWALGKTVPGWASTLGLISLLFGVLFLIVGVQGLYIMRLYEQSVVRPPFVIDRIVRQLTGADSRPQSRTPGETRHEGSESSLAEAP